MFDLLTTYLEFGTEYINNLAKENQKKLKEYKKECALKTQIKKAKIKKKYLKKQLKLQEQYNKIANELEELHK